MALDRTAVKTMIESGHASVAHLAKHFEVSVPTVEAFLRENEIASPYGAMPQYKHITKLARAQLIEPIEWKQLIFDDPDLRFVNGLDLGTTDGNIIAQDLLIHYQGEIRCLFTNELTNMVMAFDGNPQNFLVSNLVPVTEEAAKAREIDPDIVMPLLVAQKMYTYAGPVSSDGRDGAVRNSTSITVHMVGRLDPTLGVMFNEGYVDALMEQWVEPYFTGLAYRDILPAGLPPVADLFALWLWRHLSTVAFMKGIARVDVQLNGGVMAILSKDLYLQMVVGLMQRAVQSRATITRPSNIVIPNAKTIVDLSN